LKEFQSTGYPRMGEVDLECAGIGGSLVIPIEDGVRMIVRGGILTNRRRDQLKLKLIGLPEPPFLGRTTRFSRIVFCVMYSRTYLTKEAMPRFCMVSSKI